MAPSSVGLGNLVLELGHVPLPTYSLFYFFWSTYAYLEHPQYKEVEGGLGHRKYSGLDHWECCLCVCVCVCVSVCICVYGNMSHLPESPVLCVEVKVKGTTSGTRFKH